jgi:hypothetical protein
LDTPDHHVILDRDEQDLLLVLLRAERRERLLGGLDEVVGTPEVDADPVQHADQLFEHGGFRRSECRRGSEPLDAHRHLPLSRSGRFADPL